MSRIMAIDYGRKRVGIAITDPLRTIAQPLLTIKPRSTADLIEHIISLVQENDIGLILVGNPLSNKGGPTRMSREVERFVVRLKGQVDIAVELWDERYLSKYAANRLKGSGLSAGKELIDRVAASIMLEEYLQAEQA
jgi:putative Holliday junction resolvase